jgi:hypothetical protein
MTWKDRKSKAYCWGFHRTHRWRMPDFWAGCTEEEAIELSGAAEMGELDSADTYLGHLTDTSQ